MNLELLKEQHARAKDAYYNREPILSDEEFDILEEQLIELGVDINIGASVPDGKAKYPHITKMLSLDKYQLLGSIIDCHTTMTNEVMIQSMDSNELDTDTLTTCWDKYTTRTDTNKAFLSYKYDGIAINLIYDKGVLSKVLTRGDGFEGVDITKKFKDIFPQTITTLLAFVEVRCEAYMTYSDFEKYDVANGGLYKHPRNLVGGIFNDENINDPRKKDISYAVLEMVDSNDGVIINPMFWYNFSEELYNNGKVGNGIDSLEEFIEYSTYMTNSRVTLDFPTDGMVLTMDVEKHEHNGKYPNHAVAIKFIPPKLKSTITGFSWTLHKTGRYVPKIHIKPILVDGREISQMSGHNMEYLVLHDLYVGSEIDVILSNDIIPMVGKVHSVGYEIPYTKVHDDVIFEILGKELNREYLITRFNIPTDGYVDGCNLLIESGQDNPMIQKLKYYNFLEQFEIHGISRKAHEKLAEITELYEKPTFIFSDAFTYELLEQNGFGEKTAKKIVDGYKSFKKKGIHVTNVIKSLGISGCGTTITEQWARRMSEVDYDLNSLNHKVIAELNVRSNEIYQTMVDLKIEGVETIFYQDEVEVVLEDTKLVILTGSPKTFDYKTKKEFLDTFPNLKETKKFTEADYLITDDLESKSSKMTKANKQGLEIKTYGDF